MCVSQLERDTLLAVDVATRIENVIRERWGVEGETLVEQIKVLRQRNVDPRIITMLHYLRKQRNRVVHHPRGVLEDREKFERYARELLPNFERSTSPYDFLTLNLDSLIQAEIEVLTKEFSIDDEIARNFDLIKRTFDR